MATSTEKDAELEMPISIENVDDNCIRMSIANFEETMAAVKGKGVFSDEIVIGEFPWKLCVYRFEGNDPKVVLFTYKEDHSNMWYCDVEMDCILINQNEGGENHKLTPVDNAKTGILRLTPENTNTGMKQALDASLLVDPEKGFIKNGSVILEAHITVHTSGKRFREKIDHDFYSPSNASNGILIVDGKKLYVNKQILALHSPFFDRLFFGEFKEATEAETEIKDVKQSEFTTLLQILYGVAEFGDADVENVLKLADRFEMNIILDKAEKYLLNSESENIHWKLLLSDKYNLQVLQDHLLSKYTANLIRQLKKSLEYGMLSIRRS